MVTDRYVPVMFNVVYQPSIYVDVTAGVGAWLGRSIDVDNGYEVHTDRIDAQPAFNLQVIIYF